MKKILVMLMVFLPLSVGAMTMCTRDRSLVISLDPSIGGTTSGYNNSEWVWWTDFSYGRVYGDATCLSAAEGLGRTSGMGAYYGVEDYAKTTITAEPALSGLDADGNERKYCWCKMTHPASSRWVFNYAALPRLRVSRIARTSAVSASVTTPRCAGACLGRLAFDVTSNIANV